MDRQKGNYRMASEIPGFKSLTFLLCGKLTSTFNKTQLVDIDEIRRLITASYHLIPDGVFQNVIEKFGNILSNQKNRA